MSTEDRAAEVASTLETGQAAVEQAARMAGRKPDRRYVVGVAVAASLLTGGLSVAVSSAVASEVARSTPSTVEPVTPGGVEPAGWTIPVRDSCTIAEAQPTK